MQKHICICMSAKCPVCVPLKDAQHLEFIIHILYAICCKNIIYKMSKCKKLILFNRENLHGVTDI